MIEEVGKGREMGNRDKEKEGKWDEETSAENSMTRHCTIDRREVSKMAQCMT